MKILKRSFISVLLLIVMFSLSSCKIDKGNVPVYTMHTVTFMVDGTQYGRTYINEGEFAKPIESPIIEGRKFLYWGMNKEKFDFNTPIMENIKLTAYFEESAVIALITEEDLLKLSSKDFKIQVDPIVKSLNNGDIIKPGFDSSCYVYLQNQSSQDISFKVSLMEEKNILLPLQYNYREVSDDSTFIWKNISELKDLEFTIPASSRVLFSLDWVWQNIESEYKKIEVDELSKYIIITLKFSEFKIIE